MYSNQKHKNERIKTVFKTKEKKWHLVTHVCSNWGFSLNLKFVLYLLSQSLTERKVYL
jgi:hypothetical protein